MIRRWFCVVIFISLLSGCSFYTPVSYEYKGYPVTIDEQSGIIIHHNHTYTYCIDNGLLKIVYPNGVEYYAHTDGLVTTAGSSNPIDTTKYIPPEILSAIIPTSNRNSSAFPSVAIFILGLLVTIFPKGIWYLSYGHMMKNAEITAPAKMIIRISGICIMVLSFSRSIV